MRKPLYIAATGEHKGKTTCTLGLVAAIHELGINVGFCKPVGQKHVLVNGQKVDKDTVLFGELLGFEIVPEVHSPVIIASGLTAEYIKNPDQYDFEGNVDQAAAFLDANHEMVVYEGTGHAGVGSVIGLSNAQVAKRLGAEVILIVGGGIGRTFDRLNLNLGLFREQGVPVKGVIVNKVHLDKLDHVRDHLQAYLERIDIPLLGALPFDRTLSFPIMATVQKSIKGKELLHPHSLTNQVEEILAGSTFQIDEFTYFRNVLLITNQANYHSAIEDVKSHAEERGLSQCPLSGVIITGVNKKSQPLDPEAFHHSYLMGCEVPVLTTTLETYDTVVAISRIEVKINTQTPWKVKRAIELIRDNIDVSKLLNL